MSDISKDVGKVWDRLFDHKGFLAGEINFMVREFEQKREDKEVDNLFHVIENITEIKDTEVGRFKQAGNHILSKAAAELEQTLEICSQFSELEEGFKQDTTIEESRSKREEEWSTYMDSIRAKYSEICNNYSAKKEDVRKVYDDFEKKLLI